MLCETHKDILYKWARTLLAVGGLVLLAGGAAVAARLHVGPKVAATHAVGRVAQSALPVLKRLPQPRPKPAARGIDIDSARATISLYERTVKQTTLSRQGCDAAKRRVGGVVILDFGQPAYNGHTYGTYLFSGRFAGNRQITRAMLGYAVGYRR